MRILQAFLGAMAALAATACEKDVAPSTWATLDGAKPLIIAHRGASGYLPEHTLEAYALAIEQGADVIEPDLVLTKDGVLVARHDRYLSATTNVADKPEFIDRRRVNPDTTYDARDDWWVEDFTLAELKTLRARQPFDGRSTEFDDQFEIPTFAETLALIEEKSKDAGRPIGVYPETKHPGFFAAIGLDFEAPLLAALEGFDAGPVFIQSFEPDILKRLKGKTDAKLIQLVYEETPGAGSNIPLDEIAQYADGVGPAKDLILPSIGEKTQLIDRAHSLGLAVHPWTFRDDQSNENIGVLLGLIIEMPADDTDDAPSTDMKADAKDEPLPDIFQQTKADSELRLFFKFGVDGVFTDFPDTAVKARDAIQDD